jgi:site-specific recombinase XerD
MLWGRLFMSDGSPQLPVPVNGPWNTTVQGHVATSDDWQIGLTITALCPLFLEWARFEMRRSLWTVVRYRDALRWVVRDIGDLPLAQVNRGHLLTLRARMELRGCGEARIAGVLNALRSFLRFARDVARIACLDPREVRVPRIPRRDVVYLTPDEVGRLRRAILPVDLDWREAPLLRLRLRALVEVLLGTGARISEALALERGSLNFERREARIIGKGNKERTLFFTAESLEWVARYLSRRRDDTDPVFVTRDDPPVRMTGDLLKRGLERARRAGGITKKVTPHILRHTMATTLLFNGCPIGHIKELLGHERLDTTCRYYLGLDRRLAKAAHEKFLSYDGDVTP